MKSTVRPFEELGFVQRGISGDQTYGDCPLCGGRGKFYVNNLTGLWDCKKCQESGNLVTFMEKWHAYQFQETTRRQFDELAEERGIKRQFLSRAKLAFDGTRWVIPVLSRNGRMANLRFYEPGKKVVGMPELSLSIFGLETLDIPGPVWLCEGEWDALAARQLLASANLKAPTLGVPGAGTFKEVWAEHLAKRDLITGYDSDRDGVKGTRRVYDMTKGVVKSMRSVVWPDALPGKFDIRDYLRSDGTYQGLKDLLQPYKPADDAGAVAVNNAADIVAEFPTLSSGNRPSLEETLSVYEGCLRLTDDIRDAIRVVYAAIISAQIGGDPLWIFVVAPPGGTKTEVIMSCSEVANTVTRSSITVHSLVSGFQVAGGKDPSLIPQLIGKTFILKDWTEILDMPAAQKHEAYAIFRGAYDGRVERTFGNGIQRFYAGYFNMVAGVTPSVFREHSASLGERFLSFYMGHGANRVTDDIVRAAIASVGRESTIKSELSAAAKRFLEYRIEPQDIPIVPDSVVTKLTSLSQLVGMLRASVEKNYMAGTIQIPYRPQFETGSRLGKQLYKLLLGLALQHYPARVTDEDYAIVQRVALDSCIGWNLDTLRVLAAMEGMPLEDIAERANIPKQTLRDQLEELTMLGVLHKDRLHRGKPGQPPIRYFLVDRVREHWHTAGLENGRVNLSEVRTLRNPLNPNAARKPLESRPTIKRVKRSN